MIDKYRNENWERDMSCIYIFFRIPDVFFRIRGGIAYFVKFFMPKYKDLGLTYNTLIKRRTWWPVLVSPYRRRRNRRTQPCWPDSGIESAIPLAHIPVTSPCFQILRCLYVRHGTKTDLWPPHEHIHIWTPYIHLFIHANKNK